MRRARSLSWPLAAWTACQAAGASAAQAPAPAPVPAELQLEWTAPPTCPQAPEVRARIEAALRRPTVAGPAATRVVARVQPGARGFTLVLETRTAGAAVDVRRMDDRRCGVLADATAVIVATAIDEVDPNRAAPTLPPPPLAAVPEDMSPAPASAAPPPTPAPTPAPTTLSATRAANLAPAVAADDDLSPRPAAPTPAPPVARRLRAAVRLVGLGDRGSTPGLAGGLTGGVSLLGERWRLDLAAVWIAPRPTAPRADLDITARVGVLAAQLRGCAVPRLGPVEFPVCLGLEAGGARGSGDGDALARKFTDWRPWLGVLAGSSLAWSFTRRLALVVQLDLVLPIAPPTFQVAGLADPVYKGSVAAGRAGLGLEVRFP